MDVRVDGSDGRVVRVDGVVRVNGRDGMDDGVVSGDCVGRVEIELTDEIWGSTVARSPRPAFLTFLRERVDLL